MNRHKDVHDVTVPTPVRCPKVCGHDPQDEENYDLAASENKFVPKKAQFSAKIPSLWKTADILCRSTSLRSFGDPVFGAGSTMVIEVEFWDSDVADLGRRAFHCIKYCARMKAMMDVRLNASVDPVLAIQANVPGNLKKIHLAAPHSTFHDPQGAAEMRCRRCLPGVRLKPVWRRSL